MKYKLVFGFIFVMTILLFSPNIDAQCVGANCTSNVSINVIPLGCADFGNCTVNVTINVISTNVSETCPNTTELITTVHIAGAEPFLQLCQGLSFDSDSYLFKTSKNQRLYLRAFSSDRSVINSTESILTKAYITLFWPNNSISMDEVEMTYKNTSFYYVDINSTYIEHPGSYKASVRFDNTADYGYSEFGIRVNETGSEFDNLWMNTLIILLLTAGSLTTIYFFSETRNRFTRGKTDDNTTFYSLGAFMLFFIGVYVIINGFSNGYVNILTHAYGWICWGMALYFMTKPWFNGAEWSW